MILGFILMVTVYWIFHRVSVNRVDRVFRVGQLFSAAAYSLGHGGNDAQKTMGSLRSFWSRAVILQMTPEGKLPEIPLWVEFAAMRCHRPRNSFRRLADREDDGNEDR